MLRREVKRVRKGAPTFEWKRLEESRGTKTRESGKRNADRRGDGGQNGDNEKR